MARKIYGIAIDKSLFQGPIDINSMKGSFSELLDSCGLSVLLIKGLPNYTAGIDALFHPIDMKKNLDINNCILFLFLEGYDEYKILCFKERFKEILSSLDRRAPPYFVKNSGTIEYLYEDKYILNRPTLFELNISEEQERRRLEEARQEEARQEKLRQEKLRQEEARQEKLRQEKLRQEEAQAQAKKEIFYESFIFDDNNRGIKMENTRKGREEARQRRARQRQEKLRQEEEARQRQEEARQEKLRQEKQRQEEEARQRQERQRQEEEAQAQTQAQTQTQTQEEAQEELDLTGIPTECTSFSPLYNDYKSQKQKIITLISNNKSNHLVQKMLNGLLPRLSGLRAVSLRGSDGDRRECKPFKEWYTTNKLWFSRQFNSIKQLVNNYNNVNPGNKVIMPLDDNIPYNFSGGFKRTKRNKQTKKRNKKNKRTKRKIKRL